MADSPSLLEIIRDNYAIYRELGLPDVKSAYWNELLTRGRQEHRGKGDFLEREDLWRDFRRNVVTKGLDNANVPEDALPRAREKWRRMYYAIRERLPERLVPFLAECPVGNPHTELVEGIPVSQSSLEYAFMLSHLEPYLEGVKVAVDIGGGFGGLARLLKVAYPEMRLVLLDLPEVNAIQTYFLETAFPGRKLLSLRDVRHREVIDPRALDLDFLVLPGQLIERLPPGSFELVINTRSMMEMDLATVSFYLDQVQRKLSPGGFFYCLNRYRKKTRLKDYPFDDRWYVSYSAPWPRFIDENPHHELVAGRASHPVLSGLKEHLRGLPPFDGILERFLRRGPLV